MHVKMVTGFAVQRYRNSLKVPAAINRRNVYWRYEQRVCHLGKDCLSIGYKEETLWSVQNAAVRTARSSHLHTQKGKIFRHQKDAVDGFLPVLSEFCAVSAQKENRLIQNLIGCVIHAERSGKYKQSWQAVDVIPEDMQQDLRVPSAAWEEFLFR